mgnify:CR=1 FL=1
MHDDKKFSPQRQVLFFRIVTGLFLQKNSIFFAETVCKNKKVVYFKWRGGLAQLVRASES